MSTLQASRFCTGCQRPTLHAKDCLATGWGCLLTLITGGLFLLFWVPLIIAEHVRPYRCQVCGNTN